MEDEVFMTVFSNCKASLEGEVKGQVRYLAIKSQHPEKRGDPTIFKLKAAGDSSDDLISLKASLDDFTQEVKERGRPLAINVHNSPRISPLSKSPGDIQFKGVLVVAILLFICCCLHSVLKVF